MHKKLGRLLSCPNNHQAGFKFFAKELVRENKTLVDVDDTNILDDDDIKTGVAFSPSGNTAYPISEFIGVFLADEDVDKGHYKKLFEPLLNKCPLEFNAVIQSTLDRIYGVGETSEGKWNREEMKYYDAEVNTEELREKMLVAMKEKPQWRIFIPRKKHMIDLIADECKGNYVLEIGCGNSRTVYKMFNPHENAYKYIGTDISFKRLLVAKKAVPGSDFIQCSALNLPFVKSSFTCVISFGMLHHLPRPVDAIAHCHEMIQPNGLLAFHEPIIRPELPFVSSALARKFLRTYEHSEHDGKINLAQTMTLLETQNYTLVKFTKQISIFRALLESLLKKISRKILFYKFVIQIIEASDKLLLHSICLLSKKLGPNAVLVVARKNSKKNN